MPDAIGGRRGALCQAWRAACQCHRKSQARPACAAGGRCGSGSSKTDRRQAPCRRRRLDPSRRRGDRDRRTSPVARKISGIVDDHRAASSGARRKHCRNRKKRGRRDRATVAPRATDAGHRGLYRRYIGRARSDVPAGADRVHGRVAGAPRRAKSDRGDPARGCRHPRAACVELC